MFYKNRLLFISVILNIFFVILPGVRCVDQNSLRANHPVYGVSSVIDNNTENSSACFRELIDFKLAVDSGKVWGLKVLDASGRPPSGFLYGNTLWLGSHVQCIDSQNRKEFEIRNDKVDHLVTPFDYPPYELGFSVVQLRHNSSIQWKMRMPFDEIVQIGLCIPKSCKEQDILDLSKKYFSDDPLDFQKEYYVHLDVIKVRILREDIWWLFKLPKTIILITVVSTIFLLTVFGTICDVKDQNKKKHFTSDHNQNNKDKKDIPCMGLNSVELTNLPNQSKKSNLGIRILKCFSFYSNVKKWNNTKSGEDSLGSIHGLKFFAMLWVILVHTSFFERDFVNNVPYAWRIAEDFGAQIISNSTYCVDTYFFFSGFLLAYLFFKSSKPSEEKQKSINPARKCGQFVYMCAQRYFRLTPVYALSILLCDVIYTLFSKKSALYYAEQPQVLCDKYWWRNLLYINNLYPRSEMCLAWSWYLSADMQFFALILFLLVLSTMFFYLSAFLVGLLILVQISTTAYKSYSIDYIPTLDEQYLQLDAIYDLPWIRMSPHLIGAIAAYILEVKLKNKLVLKTKKRLFLWTVFPLLNLWILFTLYTRKVSIEFSAFYMAVSRPLWAVGIAWLVIATATGNARLLETFLSYKAWIPLGRLTYCAYLLNPLVVTMISLGSETPAVASIPEYAISSTGVMLITFLISFIFSLLFETPVLLLRKLIFQSDPKKSTQDLDQEATRHENADGFGSSTSTISTVA